MCTTTTTTQVDSQHKFELVESNSSVTSFPFWTADLNISKTIRSPASAFHIYFTYIDMDEPNKATGEYYYENALAYI